jgi:glycosyltransferase involved in cell wall biosynthesis
MNILIVTEYFPPAAESGITGGVENRSFFLGKELAKEHNVTVLASWQRGQKREDVIEGVKVMRCGPHHPYTNKGAILSRLRFALNVLKAGKRIEGIDIVEGNNFISYLPAFCIAKYLGLPSVATYHEVWIGEWLRNKGLLTGILGNLWERIALSKSWTHFIAVSNFTRKKLMARGIDDKKITVIPPGVNLDEIKKIHAEKAIKPTVCYIGRLISQKRVEDLICGVNIAKQAVPELRCIIIGQGGEMEKLKGLSLKLGIEKDVDFLGYIENRYDMIRLLKSSHIFCLPSIVEGFGITVIEAAACGVPLVISDIEPLVEVTHNGKGGLIFKRKDPSDLADKMVKLLTDIKLYEEKVREAEELTAGYEWKNIAINIKDLYTRQIKKKSEHLLP